MQKFLELPHYMNSKEFLASFDSNYLTLSSALSCQPLPFPACPTGAAVHAREACREPALLFHSGNLGPHPPPIHHQSTTTQTHAAFLPSMGAPCWCWLVLPGPQLACPGPGGWPWVLFMWLKPGSEITPLHKHVSISLKSQAVPGCPISLLASLGS